jgi:hypothetical protein
VKDENGDLLADSHDILNRWKNYFSVNKAINKAIMGPSNATNLHNASDIRQIEVHAAEPLVPGPSRLEVEIAIAKLENYKSPGSDQIPAELIQAGGEMLLSAINKLIHSVWNEEELPDEWKGPIILPIHKKVTKPTVIIIVGYHCYQHDTKSYRISSSQD